MRLTATVLLGAIIPGAGHLLTPGRRFAPVFLVPVGLLVAMVLFALAVAGPYGLAALLVTPGVLPLLAVLNLVLGAWRVMAVADGARRVESTRRAAVAVIAVAFLTVAVPHLIAGRAIVAANDLLDGLFAPVPIAAAPTAEPTASSRGPVVLLPVPTDVELVPGWSELPAPATLAPAPSPTVRRVMSGQSSEPLPALGAAVPWPAPGAVPWGSDGRFDLLLLGSDAGSDRWSRRMDVMLLVEVDVATGAVAMVGLPRNLLNVPLPPGPARDASPCGCLSAVLNEAYEEAAWNHPALWPGEGAVAGIGAVRGIVSELTGRPIDAVLVADLIGVVRVVDAMGGLDINVPAPLYDETYPDPIYGSIPLAIRAGQQHMDGRTALAYARSRHQDSDYGRMARQQTVLLAIRQQLGPAMILAAPDLVGAAKGAAWTDLPRESLPNLVTLFGRAAAAPVRQLRIVPPDYPEWLTPAWVTKIRIDVADLLGTTPPPSPSASPTAFPAPTLTSPPAASSSPSSSPTATSSPTASSPPAPTPSPTPSSTVTPDPPPTPSPTTKH